MPMLITLVEIFSAQILDNSPVIELDCPKDLSLVLGDRYRIE
ncbi:MAG: hypothetical protein ACTMUB_08085 [cyanobacterium endosymbiont of Rhopalodia musculus]|nr:hypothetical protein [cyanobacterium endosymbiont of Epithemia clementina EcSB]WGT68042.1 hypothetical protein P3F56_02885 [cyanobacterium endosymbiont of Epithemia clementina EcSB]